MAQHIDWTSIQTSSDLFVVLPSGARSAARLVTFSRSANIFCKGDRPAAIFYLLSGEVTLVRHSYVGGAVIIQRSRQGFFAEASIDQPKYHCDARAVEESRVIAIPLRAFDDALADKPFRQRWMAHLASELRRARMLAERLALRTARERIIHYIETEGAAGRIDLGQSKKSWAVELGLTHEALYRTLAVMERHNEIIIEGTGLRLVVVARRTKCAGQ